MCYPKPGPRCSHHARKEVKAAKEAYDTTPTEATYYRFRQAQEDALSSPAGLRQLKKKQSETHSADDIERYEHYKRIRDEKIAAYKASLEGNKDEPTPVLTGAETIDQACHSSLSYDGPAPQWWDSYNAYAESQATHPRIAAAQREIIDVLNTSEGKIAVVWEEHSSALNDQYSFADKGFRVQQLAYRSFETGEVMGYVKVTSITDEGIKAAYGDDEYTPFRYDSGYNGTSYYSAEKMEEKGASSDDVARAYWYDSAKSFGESVLDEEGERVPHYQMTMDHVPQDMTRVRADLATRSSALKKKMETTNAYYSQPYVDFSRMTSSLQGKGFGTAAYVYTARKLAEQGHPLRASGLQSDSAKPLWERLEKNFPGKVKDVELTLPDGKETRKYQVFDFR